MNNTFNEFSWHDGVLVSMLEEYPTRKDKFGSVSILAYAYRTWGSRLPTLYSLRLTGVRQITKRLNMMELSDNAGAGNITTAHCRKQRRDLLKLTMNLYGGRIEISCKNLYISHHRVAVNLHPRLRRGCSRLN